MTFKIILACFYIVAIVGAYQYSMPYPFASNSLKRSAVVLNKLILQSLRHRDDPMDDPERKLQPLLGNEATRELLTELNEDPEAPQDYKFHLQRRDPKVDVRTYSRCYFNVVSCFK